MEIILHVGAHRTATTTLQDYLRRHRPALIARGVLPILPAETRGPLFDGLIQRPADADAEVVARAAAARAAVLAECDRAAAAGLRQIVISEENFAGSLRGNLRQGQLYPDIADRMRWLGPDLRRRVVRVGLAVRSYETYWASVLAYAVAHDLYVPAPGDAARLARATRGWREVAADLVRAFPRAEIRVWPFEAVASRPARQLRALCGITDLPQIEVATRNNPSAPTPVLRAALIARGEAAAADLLPTGGRWQPFDTAQQSAMAARYRADLARIDGMAGGRVRLCVAAPPKSHHGTKAAGRTHLPAAPPEGGHHGRSGTLA